MASGDTVTEIVTGPESSAPSPGALDSTADGLDLEVLRREEHDKRVSALQALLASYVVIAVAIAAMAQARGSLLLLSAVCAANAVFTAVLLVLSRKRSVSDLASAGNGVGAAVLIVSACAYFGVSSAPVVGLPVLVYYFGMGDSVMRRRLVLGAVMGGYTLVALATLLGVIPPRGIANHANVGLLGAGVMSLVVLQSLALTYWLARRSRRTTLSAMAALEQARRRIRQRDALLDEANADLDRALAVARGGRHSGQRIGDFAVGEVIGRGAIAEVYAARHVESGEPAALKVLHPHLECEAGHVERFFREVSVTSALESRHIPRVVASGSTADGAPYLAMELLAGVDLGALLRRRKRLSLGELRQLVDEVSLALGEAHAAGVVHRDIKPQNLFRADEPALCWKVLDFGVSKLLQGTGTLTGGAAVGTPAYMAPEQIAGEEVDQRADVFALGCVIYRCLTGRPAFSGPSALATMMRVSSWQPSRPGELLQVHADVDLFFALALAKAPARRFQSAAELARAWRAACRGELDEGLRRAARALLAEQPWGAEVEGDDATTLAVPSRPPPA